MKVVVIGADGQLGSDVTAALSRKGIEAVALAHADIEVSSRQSVNSALGGINPEVIVNTAAMHQVESCEADPQRAFAINALGARNVAMFARDINAVVFHISTDYVFDGSKGAPYVESDCPLPLNVYGNSKLAGEAFVRTLVPRHFVLRVSALYGRNPCRGKGGRNFVELMLKLAVERGSARVVDEEKISPTPTSQVAEQILALIHTDQYGLYHATAEGACSWYEFAEAIFRMTNTRCKLEKALPGEFPVKAPRPAYSVLENTRLKAIGANVFSDWQSGLHQYLVTRGFPQAHRA
ncbi:MAG: dTDP-4-dehydrorhamnose reductase [Terriglobales bacterium]